MRTLSILRPLVVLALCVSFGGLACAPSALAQSPWWRLNSTSAPTNVPLHGEAQIVVTASNVGDREVNATGTPVQFSDVLPSGLTVVAVEVKAQRESGEELTQSECPHTASSVTCTFTKTLAPYGRLVMRITVESDLQEPPDTPLRTVVKVQGGNAPPATPLEKPLNVDEAPTPFGVETYELTPEDEKGSFETQAGSHPFQLTTTLDLNQTLKAYSNAEGAAKTGIFPSAPALPRDLHFKLPPGLIGDATAVPACSDVAFSTVGEANVNLCPSDTAIGVASVLLNDPTPLGFQSLAVPVFNLEPAPGEPARFGFEVEAVPVVLQTSLPAGGEYGVRVSVKNASQLAQVLSTQLTLWGTPADSSHDESRGWECLDSGTWERTKTHPSPCRLLEKSSPTAFLTLPTSCAKPPETGMSGESWAAGANFPEQKIVEGEPNTTYTFPSAMTGCETLEFNPSLTIEPDQHSASTPTGLNVGVSMPQPGLLAPEGRAESSLRQTTVTLPPGLQLNPAAANALEACSTEGFGALNQFGHPFEGSEVERQSANEHFSEGPANCPDAAKVGTVSITTPLLTHELTGSVYLAAQNTNPFRSPLAIYLIAENPEYGVRVKLAGTIEPNPVTGQLTSTFANTPQVPFTNLKLHLFGGERASLSTPPTCGPATTHSEFAPWSGETPAKPEATFQITSGAGGGPCPPSPLAFSPSFAAGPTSPAAGSFSPDLVDIGRPDGQQALSQIAVHLPPGFAAILASVTPCPEPPAGQEWSCGEASRIGEAREYAGLGSEPVTLTGQAYLTTGYGGAPFGLLVRTHAAVGPFDLGYVNVRSRINVDPNTAAVTVTSDPGPRGEAIPTILRGVPVQLKALEVAVNRPSFTFNPTDCNPLSFTGTLNGSEGAADPVSDTFKAENCASLPFKPTLTASTQGQASKEDGASLDVKVTSAGLGQANIAKVDLQLPLALPSRLSTIQKACPDAVFESTPSDPGSACDEGSVIGKARIHTPVFSRPLEGPAYLVSHGGAAFPDVEFVLQGEGVTIVLDGKTDIKDGITYSRFESAPDAPFTSFETELPAGPHSALGAYVPIAENYSLCKASLAMPTVITAQDGAVIEQETKIAVAGCSGVLASKVKLTKAQLLAKALKACKTKYKKHKSKRLACEKRAHKKYPTKAAKKAARKASKTARQNKAP
jgi:hypothetical protein